MESSLTTAVIAAGSALLGSILQPVISGWMSKRQTEEAQSAIDQRQLGQLHAEKRAQALVDLAEATGAVKLTTDRFYNAAQQAPKDYDTDILKEELTPVIEQYFQARGRYSAFEDDTTFNGAIEEFGKNVSIANIFLHQSLSQGTTDPTNSPDFDSNEFTECYDTVMKQIRDKLTEPIKEWSAE